MGSKGAIWSMGAMGSKGALGTEKAMGSKGAMGAEGALGSKGAVGAEEDEGAAVYILSYGSNTMGIGYSAIGLYGFMGLRSKMLGEWTGVEWMDGYPFRLL